MMNDFQKFATGHMGISSMVLDDVMRAQNHYLNPYILEERQLNVTQMDVFSRLMADRIIFLGFKPVLSNGVENSIIEIL